MKMELILLVLENFKCHEHLEIRFDGRNANIYGENAAGKSSIYDGLTWLLFGKDSHGKKDFDIKPLTPEGDVRDHAAITSVEAVLLVDGMTRKLKRTYYEVWSTKRGSAEATFDGHSSDYFVDDVPCKKNEFARRVGEIIEENAFRLLTSITYFAAELPWQERRAALFDVAAVATDGEIMASDARLAPLTAAMQGLTMDDYRKKLAAQRKGLNQVRTDTPARLDECKKTVTDLSNIDFAALESQLDEMLYLCDEFMRYKANFIEESINRRFSLVRFRLFREQINGGLEDCCDVTVNGVPYSTSLNSGAKVNAGIDIINTLSRHYGAHVPLFVDNAESVTQLAQADTQVIRLVVSETDRELRCELK